MANISSAVGTLTFTVDGTEEDLRYVMQTILRETRKWTYSTYVDENEIQDADVLTVKPGMFRSTVRFDGDGRWAYECNIDAMGEALKERLPEEDVEKLESLDFVIRFNYVDEESGCGLLYRKIEELRHPKGCPLDRLTNALISNTNYKYTRENLRHLFGYDEDLAQERTQEAG